MSRRRRAVIRGLERFERPRDARIVFGVCAALAERTGIHPLLVRIAFVVLALAQGIGIWLYAALWLVLPTDGERIARGSLHSAAAARLRHVRDELGQAFFAARQAVRFQGTSPGRGDTSWPRELNRYWLGLGLALVGAVVVFGTFGLFDWVTPARATGLAVLALGVGLVLSANRSGGPSQERRY